MRRRLAIIGSGLLLAGAAHATTWTALTHGADGAIVSLDLTSIQAKDGWVRVWVQYDFTHVRTRKERGLVLLQEINCNGRYSRVVASRFYAPDGQITSSDEQPSAYAEVIPGSTNERIGRRACALGAARGNGMTEGNER